MTTNNTTERLIRLIGYHTTQSRFGNPAWSLYHQLMAQVLTKRVIRRLSRAAR